MRVVTLNGQFGSDARGVGAEVAHRLGADYVDRLILAEAGKRVGATVEALAEKEQHPATLGERLAHLFRTALERSAYSGAGGDPFALGMDALLLRPYPEGEREPATRAQEVDDRRFFSVISDTISDLAREGNVVIVGRGSNLVLKKLPEAFHVGVVADLPWRMETIMRRQGVDRAEAERVVTEAERARVGYFKRFFQVHPDDPSLYHLVINTGLLGVRGGADIVTQAASQRK